MLTPDRGEVAMTSEADRGAARLATVLGEPKIDCHVHVLDPTRFPYRADTHYAPAGQEIGTPAQLAQVMDAYGTRHALLVGPNSGYGLDNRCMLDTIAHAPQRYKGIAVVRNDIAIEELETLQRGGVIGVAWNVTHYGVDHYRDALPLLRKLAALDLWVDLQTEHDQLIRMMPLLDQVPEVRILVDHCGRPTLDAGLADPGFAALLALGRTGRAVVKLSGYVKYSRAPAPYVDAWPFMRALVDAFTLDRCLWASDWPYLRAPARVDYGVLLGMLPALFPHAADRRRLLWDTPRALLGFPAA
jgi:predicted TIM-barrel fold metal-dependent hydrolase